MDESNHVLLRRGYFIYEGIIDGSNVDIIRTDQNTFPFRFNVNDCVIYNFSGRGIEKCDDELADIVRRINEARAWLATIKSGIEG